MKGSGSVNMQLIRAINKSNKSNNNNNGSANQTSSTNNSTTNKVVIVTPPTSSTTQQPTQAVSQNANNNNSSASVVPQPSSGSPSVSLPPLKKRTTIVKQAVPPPPPPRKSSPAPPARSKSNNNHKSSSFCTSRIIVNVDRLQCLSEMTSQSGNLKVKKWLESVELSHSSDSVDEASIPDEVSFKGVKKLIESFTIKGEVERAVAPRSNRKVSDSCLVKARVEGFNTLEKKVRNQSMNILKSETDSGIEVSSKPTSFLKFRHQFSRDGEFV